MKNLLILFFTFYISTSFSNDVTFKISTDKLADDVIWGLDFINSEDIIYTLKSGKIFFYNFKQKKKTEIKHQIQSIVHGQGGLLDVMVDGEDLYFTYAKEIANKNITTALFKGKIKDGVLVGNDIFIADTLSDKAQHFGSRVVKLENALFMSIGDRGKRDESQNLSNHHGVIVKLTLDGKAYSDNPFKENPFIFSYGHRNPQGLAVDNTNKKLYEVEFGPRGGDELNLIEAGKNYGWPVITYGTEYWGPKIGTTTKKGMEQPLHFWVPSISPSGMMIYQHDKFKKWRGQFFLANLSSRHLRRLKLQNNKVIEQDVMLKEENQRMRVVKQSPDGDIFIGTDDGTLIRIY